MKSQIKYTELSLAEKEPVNDIINDAIKYDYPFLEKESVMADPDSFFIFFETKDGVEIEKI